MAARWWHTWSIGLATADYSNSSWGVNGTPTTNNATNLGSPSASGVPGDEFNCWFDGDNEYVNTPTLPGSALGGGGSCSAITGRETAATAACVRSWRRRTDRLS